MIVLMWRIRLDSRAKHLYNQTQPLMQELSS